MHTGHGCEAVEPEPEEQVNLLVDDVQAEDAEAVELLLAGGRANAVERATRTITKKMRA